jgi:hypothetical protein
MTLCTTWTKVEAKEEEVELDQPGARFIIRPEGNKWRSLVPIFDFLEGGANCNSHLRGGLFYASQILTC